MKRMMNFLGIPALLAFGAAFSPAAAQATHATHQSRSYKRDLPAALTKEATVSESDAAKTAESRVRNGRIEAVELENEKGKLIYSYALKAPGKSGVEEVNVDAKTGQVVSTEHESMKTEKKEEAQERKETAHSKPATHARSMSHAKHDTTATAKKPTR
ncbi:MAG TPA: PepSY domain-containing protein [Gemmatimonadaceae bacterium]|nr:PepSY domain-containing protein [Gemmatimonadaceae bacterium]